MLAAARKHQKRRFAGKKLVRVKHNRGRVRLLAEDDERVRRRSIPDDGVGKLLGPEHRIETGECDVRGDEEYGRSERQAYGGRNLFPLEAQDPADSGTDKQSSGSQRRRKTQRRERCAREIEEVRHGQRVIPHAAVSQHGADVCHVGQIARVPQSPGKGRCGKHANHGKYRLPAGEPAGGEQRMGAVGAFVRRAVHSAFFFNACNHAGDKDEQRRPHRKGVVLLVGGDGEEQQAECGEEA